MMIISFFYFLKMYEDGFILDPMIDWNYRLFGDQKDLEDLQNKEGYLFPPRGYQQGIIHLKGFEVQPLFVRDKEWSCYVVATDVMVRDWLKEDYDIIPREIITRWDPTLYDVMPKAYNVNYKVKNANKII